MRKVLTIGLMVAVAAPAAFAATGYGDGYGWKSGADAPAYSWVDTSSGTEILEGVDDGYTTITTPFDITFSDTLHAAGSNFYVSSNGLCGFNSSGMNYLSNTDIPNTADPDNYMAYWWDDLRGYSPGDDCRYMTTGTAPDRVFVITYKPWHRYGYSTNAISFQILIYENDGTFNNSIRMQYEDVVCGSSYYDYGASATVGLENEDGTAGCKYSYNTASLANSLVIEYRDAKPTAFDLLTPTNGTTIDIFPLGGRVSVDVDFTWEESTTYGPGAITYDLFVDDNDDFSSPEYEVYDITGEAQTITFDVTETVTYYWRVVAKESQFNKTRQCNEDFSFTFDYTPGSFALTSPADGSVIDVFGRGEGGSAVSAVVGSGAFRAVDPGAKTARTNNPVDVDVEFTWEESAGADEYELLVDDNDDFSSPEEDIPGITEETETVTFTVDSDITYYWRVIASNGSGDTPCEADFDFSFNYNNTAVVPASIGAIKAGFH